MKKLAVLNSLVIMILILSQIAHAHLGTALTFTDNSAPSYTTAAAPAATVLTFAAAPIWTDNSVEFTVTALTLAPADKPFTETFNSPDQVFADATHVFMRNRLGSDTRVLDVLCNATDGVCYVLEDDFGTLTLSAINPITEATAFSKGYPATVAGIPQTFIDGDLEIQSDGTGVTIAGGMQNTMTSQDNLFVAEIGPAGAVDDADLIANTSGENLWWGYNPMDGVGALVPSSGFSTIDPWQQQTDPFASKPGTPTILTGGEWEQPVFDPGDTSDPFYGYYDRGADTWTLFSGDFPGPGSPDRGGVAGMRYDPTADLYTATGFTAETVGSTDLNMLNSKTPVAALPPTQTTNVGTPGFDEAGHATEFEAGFQHVQLHGELGGIHATRETSGFLAITAGGAQAFAFFRADDPTNNEPSGMNCTTAECTTDNTSGPGSDSIYDIYVPSTGTVTKSVKLNNFRSYNMRLLNGQNVIFGSVLLSPAWAIIGFDGIPLNVYNQQMTRGGSPTTGINWMGDFLSGVYVIAGDPDDQSWVNGFTLLALGVPEFSLTTMLLAVLISGFVLMFVIRRRK